MADSNETDWACRAVTKYETALVRYAAQILGAVEPAREVVQEAFLRMWKAGPKRIDHYLAPWLFTVTRNLAFDHRRKEKRMTPLADPGSVANPISDDAGTGDTAERLAAVQRSLGALSEKQQEVVRLKFQAGLSYKDIARVTGLSVSNVGFLHTAVRALRSEMCREGGQS